MNKSEELAKLFGIKPLEAENDLGLCKRVIENIDYECNFKCKNCKFNILYPDFTKPSNFLPLWEMCDNNDREQFIDIFIEFMKNNTYHDVDDYYRDNYQKAEEYKQQAQQVKWEY